VGAPASVRVINPMRTTTARAIGSCEGPLGDAIQGADSEVTHLACRPGSHPDRLALAYGQNLAFEKYKVDREAICLRTKSKRFSSVDAPNSTRSRGLAFISTNHWILVSAEVPVVGSPPARPVRIAAQRERAPLAVSGLASSGTVYQPSEVPLQTRGPVVQSRGGQVAAVSVRQVADIPAGSVNPMIAGCGRRKCYAKETAASLALATMSRFLRLSGVTSECGTGLQPVQQGQSWPRKRGPCHALERSALVLLAGAPDPFSGLRPRGPESAPHLS